MMRWAALAVACGLAGPVLAQDVMRPIARATTTVVAPAIAESEAPAIRPTARPLAQTTGELDDGPLTRGAEVPVGPVDDFNRPKSRIASRLAPFSEFAVRQSLRPLVRPASMEAAAEERRIARLRGQVCGDPSIQGKVVGRVNGAGACGIEGAVRLRSVAGVSLNPRATIDCPTARALKTWVERGVLPAVGSEGGGASSLRVVSHYACRTRNNQPGARLSEHSFGRAIDIAGIRLRDGTEMTLLTDWNSQDDGAQLRQMWRAACGPFGTVLGPEANRFHRDHFHFDTARYRSGAFCR